MSRSLPIPAAAALLTACLAALTAPSAHAFLPYTTDGGVALAWHVDTVHVVVGDDLPSDLTEARVTSAITAGFDAWALPCHPITVVVDGFAPVAQPDPDNPDRENHIFWEHDVQKWNARFRPTELARTAVTYRQTSGEIVDVDVSINVAGFVFSETQTCGADYDLQNMITHEAGHFFGLDHSMINGATMFDKADPGDCGMRTLHADDMEGYCATYGPLSADPDPTADAGPIPDTGDGAETVEDELVTMSPSDPDCAGAPSGPPAWLLLLVAGWLLIRVARSSSRRCRRGPCPSRAR